MSKPRANLTIKGVLFAAALVLAVGGILAVSRRVIKPLQDIQNAMQKVAEGALDVEVPFLDRADEIGGFAKALATFKQNAGEKVHMEAEQQARRERAGARQAAIEAHIATFEKQIQEALRALTAASGDMRATSQTLSTTAGQTDGQARSAATLSTETSSNVQTVATASEELASSIGDVSTVATSIASAVEEQGAATHEITRNRETETLRRRVDEFLANIRAA